MIWSRQSGEGTCSFKLGALWAWAAKPKRLASARLCTVALLRKSKNNMGTKDPLMRLNRLFCLIIFEFLG